MQWSYALAGSLEVFVEGFGLPYCFIEESIAKTVGLYTSQYSLQVCQISQLTNC